MGKGHGILWSDSVGNAANSTWITGGPSGNTLEVRNSTNPQAFRIYNSYTDVSNYERGFVRWNSNVLEVGAEAAGTGTTRNTRIYGSNGYATFGNYVLALSNMVLDIGNNPINNIARIDLNEGGAPSAPASGAYIYAEDNGSGKTRIMARFATGAAVQIAIEP